MRPFDALESWRGIAACRVALYHLWPQVNYEQRLGEGFSLWRFSAQLNVICKSDALIDVGRTSASGKGLHKRVIGHLAGAVHA